MSEIETWLEAIEERMRRARPAPWDRERIETALIRDCHHGHPYGEEGWADGSTLPTSEFIAEARNSDLPSLLALVRQYREALTEGLACLRLAADTARIHGNERLTVTLDNACRQVSAALEAMPHD